MKQDQQRGKVFPWKWALAFMVAWLWCCPFVWAQTEAESAGGSVALQSPQDTILIAPGTKLSIKYTIDPRTFPDQVLQGAVDSALLIGADTVGVEYFERITLRKHKTYKAGKTLFLLSVAVTVALAICAGLIFLFPGNIAVMIILGVIMILLSIPGSVAFPTGLIVGGVLMLVSNKTYLIGSKWKLQAKGPGQPVKLD